MDNIQEGTIICLIYLESDDCGTPTPGKYSISQNYTFTESLEALKCKTNGHKPSLKTAKSEVIYKSALPPIVQKSKRISLNI